jgi:hypothetical protein
MSHPHVTEHQVQRADHHPLARRRRARGSTAPYAGQDSLKGDLNPASAAIARPATTSAGPGTRR